MSSGAINDRDVEDWKSRINEVLAKPSEHIHQKSPENAQSWHESFFGCLSPIDLCLVSWCLPCVTFGKTHHRIRKDPKLEGYEPINTSVGLFKMPREIQDMLTTFYSACSCAVLAASVFTGSRWPCSVPTFVPSTILRATASSTLRQPAAAVSATSCSRTRRLLTGSLCASRAA